MAEPEKEPPKEKEDVDLNSVFGAKKKRKKKVTVEEDSKDIKETKEIKDTKETKPKVEKEPDESKEPEEDKQPIAGEEKEDETSDSFFSAKEPEGSETKEVSSNGTRESKFAGALADFPSFSDKDYTYEQLVARLFGMISAPEEKITVKIKPPIVYKEGTTRTAWANFPQICASINRQADHVLQFVLAEVASTGSLDGNGRLLIRGRFQQKHMERILRHYIVEYVQCHTCKSLETKLQKENRLLFMKCDTCGSTRSVAQIKTGFQATTRASRRTQQQSKT